MPSRGYALIIYCVAVASTSVFILNEYRRHVQWSSGVLSLYATVQSSGDDDDDGDNKIKEKKKKNSSVYNIAFHLGPPGHAAPFLRVPTQFTIIFSTRSGCCGIILYSVLYRYVYMYNNMYCCLYTTA